MRRFVGAVVTALVLAGCTASPPPAGGADADRTLASLRKVDDLPLYEMRYAGDYDATRGLAEAAPATPFGCSLFAAPGPLFGRNFDWDANPAMVLHTDPPDGHASVSIVDISYLGVGADPTGDRRLLDAPLLPFDGMNERGLFVGLAADESATATADPAKPTVGGVRVMRLVLDSAATVDEAVAVFDRYNLDFDGGPALHYLIADRSGAAAVVEYVDGRMRVVRDTRVLTNIRLSGVTEAQRRTDHRYATAATALSAAGGAMNWEDAMGVLRDVAQGHTRWSAVYDPVAGTVRVVAGQRWNTVHTFELAGF
jgi:Linear amide C-N hydrolases, choloylglycine hydrolase family